MKKLIYIVLSAVIFCGLFAGCTVEEEPGKSDSSQYSLYYLDSAETEIKKEAYYPEEETTESMLQDFVTRLNNKSEAEGRGSLLPGEVQIDSYEIKDSVLNVEFNNAYSDMSRAREILARAGVVKTLIQVPGIVSVKFFVGGNELTDTKGQPVGEMKGSTFVELYGTDKDSYRHDTFTLYFTDKDGKNLVEEQRSVSYRRSLPRERVILEQLAKGPMVKGHYPTLPDSAEVISVAKSDRVCYVDFDEAFMDYALDISEYIPIYSVVNSLLAATDVDKVEISVNGQTELTFGENMSLYNYYEWNPDLILSTEETQE